MLNFGAWKRYYLRILEGRKIVKIYLWSKERWRTELHQIWRLWYGVWSRDNRYITNVSFKVKGQKSPNDAVRSTHCLRSGVWKSPPPRRVGGKCQIIKNSAAHCWCLEIWQGDVLWDTGGCGIVKIHFRLKLKLPISPKLCDLTRLWAALD